MNNNKAPQSLRILFVEDNEHDQAAFRRAVKKAPFVCEITACVRAEEALERLGSDASQFDILVADFGLPGMSGLDMFRELMDRKVEIPTVILTGTGSEQIAVDALKAGVYDYILKDPDQRYLNLLPIVLKETVRKNHDRLARKQAEEALRVSEELHKEAQRVAHIGHWELDPEIGNPVWSDEIFRIFGLKPQEREPSFTDYETHLHPDDWPLLNKAVTLASTEGTPFDIIFRIVRPDSETRWMHAIGTTTKDEKGKVTKLFGTAQDITDRKRTEEALRGSEEKYRTILESIEDGYYEIDLGGNLTFFNDSMCKISGYSRDELMGMNNRQYTEEVYAKEIYQTFNKVYSTGKPNKSSHWPVIGKDGTKKTVAASVSLRRDTEGEPMGFRGIIRDISERKRFEAKLQQANKMEAIATLAGGVAHEFNNGPDGDYGEH